MCPCSPNDISFPSPSGPSVPGFPFVISVPTIPFPAGFPEDLLSILDLLQLLIPPGALKPALNPNFGKDIFDGIMKLLDQFMPFLMLYKFFLPILNIIICIIEVLCALMNPFALIGALDRLFTQCIPEFLNLFPIFALIIMIISLLLLLLQLILYIINTIIKFIIALLRNINALVLAFQSGNAAGVLAIANKLASLLCVFQNLFVLLSLFGIIIQIIKDILSLIFSIPPCEGGDNSNCCSPLTCPAIVQNPTTSSTGNLQYFNQIDAPITGFTIPGFPQPTFNIRNESWQVWDNNQVAPTRFWDIAEAQDAINDGYNPPPIFFPTTAKYDDTTPPGQAAYTVDVRVFYDPAQWSPPGHLRPGVAQYIRFNKCIVLAAPTQNLLTGENNNISVPNGVLYITGGQGFLDDNKTILDGYQPDGFTPLPPHTQASLNNFLFLPPTISTSPVLDDGYTFNGITNTLTPNTPILMQANLVTAGCQPAIMFNRAFINNVMFSNISVQTTDLKALVNSGADQFPDPAGAEQCLLAAVSALRSNMTVEGVAEFQTVSSLCLAKLQNATTNALGSAIGIGFSPCDSNFSLTPNTQFTTQPIVVTVNLNENNGLPLTQGVPPSVAAPLADQIKGYPTFGSISNFAFDGYQAFTALLTSDQPGNGSLMIAFQNKTLCTNNLPSGGTPSHVLQNLDYQFVYAPSGIGGVPQTGEGDTTGEQPRRDAGDLAREGGD